MSSQSSLPSDLVQSLLNLSLESRVQLAKTSRDGRAIGSTQCLPTGNTYRDVFEAETECLPGGAHVGGCCEYTSVRFFRVILELLNHAVHNEVFHSRRVQEFHYWLQRKFQNRQGRAVLPLTNNAFAPIHRWLQLIPVDLEMQLMLEQGPLSEQQRTNLSVLIRESMVRMNAIWFSCQGMFVTNMAVQHALRTALRTDHDQFIQLHCTTEERLLSRCIDHILHTQGGILQTNNSYRFDAIGATNTMTLRNLITKFEVFDQVRQGQHLGPGRVTIRFPLQCLRNVQNSDWTTANANIAMFHYGPQNNDRIFTYHSQFFFVQIVISNYRVAIIVSGLEMN